MQAIVDNDIIKIQDPSQELLSRVRAELCYVDKSKEYQIKRMSRNLYSRNSPLYAQLLKEVSGNLFKYNNNVLEFSSSFFNLYKDIIGNFIDNRKSTGTTIALPWANKPHAMREYQEECVELMVNGCHTADQLILMYDGSLKQAKDVIIGDYLMGPDSSPRQVLSLNRGVDTFYEIKPTKGESFSVNAEHTLSLRRSYSNIRRYKKDNIITNITVNEYLKQKKSFKHKYKLYKTECIEYKHQELLIAPYILGLWLGDGCKLNPKITSMDPEVEVELKRYADSIGVSLIKRSTKSKAFNYTLVTNRGQKNIFRSYLQQLNLINNKHIPALYKISSKQQRLKLLAGLLDTDGSYYGGIFEIVQKDQELAESIIYIARSLGFAAYIKKSYKVATNSKDKIKNLYYRITITGELDRIPTRIKRKQAQSRKQVKNVLNTGFSIIEKDVQPFYGFTVNKDHLYVMGDFTVTHNCNHRGLICAATGLGKSLMMINAIKQIKKKTLIIVPSESIATQFYDSLVSAFGKNRVALFGKGKKKVADITVGIAASVTRHIDLFQISDLGLVMFDETHMIAASTFFDIANGLAKVGKLFGLTATDFRSDGKDIMITAGCGPALINRDVRWGIENGWLAIPSFIIREVKTGGRDIKDDKLKSYKEHVLNNPIMKARIEGDARDMMAAGKSVLILVDEVAHGEELSKNLGIPFATGEDKKSSSYLDDLNAGRVPGLVGTDGKIGMGADTRNVDVLIMAQFTASRGPVLQAVGRALRKQGTKVSALILDYKIVDSTMLNRHAQNRIGFYNDITDRVKVVKI